MKDATVYILSEIRRMFHGVISVPVFLQEVDADIENSHVIVQLPYRAGRQQRPISHRDRKLPDNGLW